MSYRIPRDPRTGGASTLVVIRAADGAAIPRDPANADYARFLAWQAAGGVAVVDPAPAVPVPASVGPLQARRALRSAGLHAAVATYVAAQPAEVQEAWEYASEVLRTDPMIAGAATTLGLSSAQVDDLFRLAATL